MVKAAILVGTAPALFFFARQRVDFTARLNPNQESDVTGFESAVGPLNDFAVLMRLSDAGELGLHGLSTLFAAVVAPIPRSLWPDKPVGLGSILGDLLRPDLRGSGHSQLALFHGEWIYAFGFLGLLAMIPLVGYLVLGFDRLLLAIWRRGLTEKKDLVAFCLLTIFAAGLPDLLWGGSFTYLSRALVRSLALVVILIPLIPTAVRGRRIARRKEPPSVLKPAIQLARPHPRS